MSEIESLINNVECEYNDDEKPLNPTEDYIQSGSTTNNNTPQELDVNIIISSFNSKEYIHEIIESFMKIVVLLYLMNGILFIISRSASILSPGPPTNNILYSIVLIISCSFNLIIFILTIYNRFSNSSIFETKLSFDKWIYLYIIMLPLSILSVINITLNVINACHRVWFSTIFITEVAMVLGAISICLADIKYEEWWPRALDKFTKDLLVSGFIIVFSFNIFITHDYEFTKVAKNYFNVSFYSYSCNNSKITNSWYFNNYILSLSTSSFSFFIIVYISTIVYQIDRNPTPRFYCNFKLNTKTITIFIVNVILSFIPLFLFFVSINKQWITMILTQIFANIIYLCGIGCSIYKIREVWKWEKIPDLQVESNIFDRIFIWSGFLGQMLICAREIGYSMYKLSKDNLSTSDSTVLGFEFLVAMFAIIQTISQVCLIEVSLDRKWNSIQFGQLSNIKLSPSFILIGVNFACLLISIYKEEIYKKDAQNSMVLDLFCLYTYFLPRSLVVVQRLHGTMYFLKLFLYTENVMENYVPTLNEH